MKAFQFLLASFIPVLSFFFLPFSQGRIQNNVYSPKFYLLLGFVLLGSLWKISLNSQGVPLVVYFKTLRLSKIVWPVIFYILWIAVSSTQSGMPGYAWLGSNDLQVGSLFLILCYVTAILYLSAIEMNWLIRSLALTTGAMAIIALLEAIGFRPLWTWIHSNHMIFPAATVGHRQHLGGWFAIMSLAPVYFYRNRVKDGWFWLWLTSSLLGLSLATTSAATLGVGVGLLLWLVIDGKRGRWKLPLIVVAAFTVGIFAVPRVVTFTSQMIGLTPPVFKDYGSAYTLKARKLLWKSAWNAALERPVFGWGDETFAYQVFEHLSPGDARNLFRYELSLSPDARVSYGGFTYYVDDNKKNIHSTGSILYHRAHNIIIDELYSHGFTGLLLLLVIIFPCHGKSIAPAVISVL